MKRIAWFRWPLIALLSLAAAHGADLRLIEAIHAGDMRKAGVLLGERIDVNAREGDGATALHWAVHRDDESTTAQLLRLHADVNAANDYGVTPLWLAATNGNAPITDLLLKAGADPNRALSNGATPLMAAARSGSVAVVKALLARDARVNARETRRGQTALMWAVNAKHPEAAKLLIEYGANVKERSIEGFTPLLFAARSGDRESAGYLLAAGADINEASPDGRTVLFTAATSLAADSTGEFIAVHASDHEALAMWLLERGANPKEADNFGVTPLHGAVRTGKKELVRALLARGADPNAQIKKRPPTFMFTDLPERDWDLGATPFFMAAKAANAGLMRVLAAAGADSRLAVASGTTPLMAAAGVGRAEGASPVSEKTVFDAVSAALELGSDVNAANKAGTTALHSAANQGLDSVIDILVQSGAALDVKDRLGRTPLSMAEGAKTEGNTILLYRPETAERLRKLGAKVGLLETEGIDPKGERK